MLDKMKVFFGFQEEEAPKLQELAEPVHKPVIKNMSSMKNLKFGSSEIKVEEPKIYEDSLSIATYLRENKPVIVNLKSLDASTGKRLIDFICGTAYAINGHMMKIGENIFLFTPENVLIADSEESKRMDTGTETESSVFLQESL